jgi:hypothetical protein
MHYSERGEISGPCPKTGLIGKFPSPVAGETHGDRAIPFPVRLPSGIFWLIIHPVLKNEIDL